MSFKVDSEGVAVKHGLRPEVAKKWVEALRSGDYLQTQDALQHTKDTDENPAGFCCLGVLCDVAVKEGLDIKVVPLNGGQVLYGSDEDARLGELPRSVMEWAGLTSSDPIVEVPNLNGDDRVDNESLSALNDTYYFTFDQIADVITKAVQDGEL